MHMGVVRTGLRAAATVVTLAIVVPVWVVVAALAGLEPEHWTGVRLAEVELPVLKSDIVAAPEPANMLLSAASFQDDRDTGDLAPSYWDAGTGQVVLGAVTDAGVDARRNIGESSGTAYRIDRRPYSVRELTAVMHAVVPTAAQGALWSAVDGEHDRVLLGVSSLGHSTFTELATRHGDAVAVVAAPFHPVAYLDERPADPPSWWSRADPPGTWLTLATGFPWYLGSAVAVAALLWLLPLLRRPRGQPLVAHQHSKPGSDGS